jgi:hypothetical protein
VTHSTLDASGFLPGTPVDYVSKASGLRVSIPPESIIEVIVNTNEYLSHPAFFANAEFEFYETIGQRNLSGFIGEVFVNFFRKTVVGYAPNPHADGRPDILDLSTDEAATYYERECFKPGKHRQLPVRGNLAPFKFGGLEVKATIGDPISKKAREGLFKERNISGFTVGMPRIDFLRALTYWGHHTSCENLIGLYYDYVPELQSSPQVLLAMHAELDAKLGWGKVSVGRSSSKKTSNTSVTKTARESLYRNVIAVTAESRYLGRLRQMGLNVPNGSTGKQFELGLHPDASPS